METKTTGSLCMDVTVEGLTHGEVMQSLRRLIIKQYLLLWLAVYVVMAVYMLISKKVTVFTVFGPAFILLLLWGAYEFTAYKNYGRAGYDKVKLQYRLTPAAFTLKAGDSEGTVKWSECWVKETKLDLLLYSNKTTCSILPKRFLKEGEKEKILEWAGKQE